MRIASASAHVELACERERRVYDERSGLPAQYSSMAADVRARHAFRSSAEVQIASPGSATSSRWTNRHRQLRLVERRVGLSQRVRDGEHDALHLGCVEPAGGAGPARKSSVAAISCSRCVPATSTRKSAGGRGARAGGTGGGRSSASRMRSSETGKVRPDGASCAGDGWRIGGGRRADEAWPPGLRRSMPVISVAATSRQRAARRHTCTVS